MAAAKVKEDKRKGKKNKGGNDKKTKKKRGRQRRSNEEDMVTHSDITLRVLLTFGNKCYMVSYISLKDDRQFGSG